MVAASGESERTGATHLVVALEVAVERREPLDTVRCERAASHALGCRASELQQGSRRHAATGEQRGTGSEQVRAYASANAHALDSMSKQADESSSSAKRSAHARSRPRDSDRTEAETASNAVRLVTEANVQIHDLQVVRVLRHRRECCEREKEKEKEKEKDSERERERKERERESKEKRERVRKREIE